MASTSQSGPPTGSAQGPPRPTGNGPFTPQIWQYGGVPDIIPDLVLCAIFLALYVLSAAIHMTIFQINKKKSHLFALSAMTFGFSMCRIFTFVLRLVWSVKPTNASIALASNIFVAAGTPILYIINLVFAHRIIRAQHPKFGWHKSLSVLARAVVVSVVGALILLIFSGITMAFTLNTGLRQKCRSIQLFGTTFYTFIAFLPIPMVIIGLVLPKRIRTEKFGQGRFRTKIIVLLTSTLLLTFRAVWGTTAAWLPPIPRQREAIPWYYSKPAFYCVQLLPELLVVYLYAFVRVDRRFFTPTGQRNSYLVLPNTHQSSSTLVGNIKAPKKAYHGHVTASDAYRDNRHGSNPSSNYNSESNNSMTSSTHAPLRVFTEEELFSETATLASTLNPNMQSSIFFNEEKDKFELVSGDTDSLYQYSVRHSFQGSRANMSPRIGPGESRLGRGSTHSRWSLQSMQEISAIVEGDNSHNNIAIAITKP